MMKKKLYSTFAMLSIMVMLAVVTVQAQSKGKLEINIPFEFQIGSQTLPAGEYSVKRLTQNSILVQSADGKESVIAQTPGTIQARNNKPAAREKLVFHKYSSQYFLSQVWMVRGSDGRVLNQTDAEREAAKAQNLARSGAKPQSIEVAATVR
jgi:hypothetical protein